FQEREILYKLLFEMKSDLNDLKSLVFELIQRNNLRVPNLDSLKQLGTPTSSVPAVEEPAAGFAANEDFTYTERKEVTNGFEPEEKSPYQPIILNQKDEAYDNAEVVEESLSLEDMEKELIKKALKKHKGRRKDAAHDLGISERTLYRKINQYQL
ncbi:MAG: helix-turn-helix domain-containing protein, partial [Bacteroidota bacterium]